MTIHKFSDSGEAYDATQCGMRIERGETPNEWEEIKVERGDVLWIEDERVLGICDTWPFAVTKEHGKLHHIANSMTGQRLNEAWWKQHMSPLSAAGVLLAIRQLDIKMEELDDSFLSLQPWMMQHYGFNLERMPGSGEGEESLFTQVANALGLTTEQQQAVAEHTAKVDDGPCDCEDCKFSREALPLLRFGMVANMDQEDDDLFLYFEDTIENRLGISILMQVGFHGLQNALEQDGECTTDTHVCDFVPPR